MVPPPRRVAQTPCFRKFYGEQETRPWAIFGSNLTGPGSGFLFAQTGGCDLANSAMTDLLATTREQRRTFFKYLFGVNEGFLCMAVKDVIDGSTVHHTWYLYPNDLDGLLNAIEEQSQQRQAHFWFGTALYKEPNRRVRQNIATSNFAHADLDECDPKYLKLPPSILIQTSPGRFQAYWVMQDPVSPTIAEDINTRIAYAHKEQGADMCHDAGHLMRIPYTPNYKYGQASESPVVTIISSTPGIYRPADFKIYPAVKALKFLEQSNELPDTLPTDSAQEIIDRYGESLSDKFYNVYYVAPPDDSDALESKWSGSLWSLMQYCIEAGLTKEETFVVANTSACNKFKRDGKDELALWQDVNRAFVKHIEKMQLIASTQTVIPELLTEQEVHRVQNRETFVERYINWAKGMTDAPTQYHQAGAFVILSSLLAGNMYVSTSHEKVYPNLWFMLLAGTTLTRKSTAQRTAMHLAREINPEIDLATDGSVEGILSALSDRPGEPSVFLKDEFTGLLEAIAHKDYMAGFVEQLTKLYDGDSIRRVLRKEVIEVRDPRFIIFAAGIKDKIQQLLTEEHVMSGFVPRFIFISGDATIKDIRLTRPPSIEVNLDSRELLKNELMDMFLHYHNKTEIHKGGKLVGTVPTDFEASLSPEAWARYNVFERQMMETADSTGLGFLMPVYVRLTVSTLKAALLLAASRQREEGIIVEELDILHAIYYCRKWREYASEIINGVGKTYDERLIMKIYDYIGNNDLSGVPRAELMRVFQLDYKRADLIFGTMTQRNMVYQMDVHGQRKYRRVGVS
jgi:hypothetical protein